jgi:hypothetical protein
MRKQRGKEQRNSERNGKVLAMRKTKQCESDAKIMRKRRKNNAKENSNRYATKKAMKDHCKSEYNTKAKRKYE